MKLLKLAALLLISCGSEASNEVASSTLNEVAVPEQNVQPQNSKGETWLKLSFEGNTFQSSNEVMAMPDRGKNQIRIQGENMEYIIVIDMEAKRGIGSRFGKGYVFRKMDNTKVYDTENENVGTALTLTIESMDDFQIGGFMEGSFTFTREEADGSASSTDNGRFKARLGKLN